MDSQLKNALKLLVNPQNKAKAVRMGCCKATYRDTPNTQDRLETGIPHTCDVTYNWVPKNECTCKGCTWSAPRTWMDQYACGKDIDCGPIRGSEHANSTCCLHEECCHLGYCCFDDRTCRQGVIGTCPNYNTNWRPSGQWTGCNYAPGDEDSCISWPWPGTPGQL